MFAPRITQNKKEGKEMRRIMTILALCTVSVTLLAQTPVKATFVDGTDKAGKESADKVVDGRKFTKWCYQNEKKLPYFVVLSVGETPITLKEYILTTGDDTASYPDRNPASWVVSGSNDMKNWKVVDEKHSYLRMAGLNLQDYYYPVKAKEAYKYYKFEFIEMHEGSRIQLSEISLFK